MNELYEKTITIDGKLYHYDPDRDIYYVRYAGHTHMDLYGWLYMIAVLAIVVYLTA